MDLSSSNTNSDALSSDSRENAKQSNDLEEFEKPITYIGSEDNSSYVSMADLNLNDAQSMQSDCSDPGEIKLLHFEESKSQNNRDDLSSIRSCTVTDCEKSAPGSENNDTIRGNLFEKVLTSGSYPGD